MERNCFFFIICLSGIVLVDGCSVLRFFKVCVVDRVVLVRDCLDCLG